MPSLGHLNWKKDDSSQSNFNNPFKDPTFERFSRNEYHTDDKNQETNLDLTASGENNYQFKPGQ